MPIRSNRKSKSEIETTALDFLYAADAQSVPANDSTTRGKPDFARKKTAKLPLPVLLAGKAGILIRNDEGKEPGGAITG